MLLVLKFPWIILSLMLHFMKKRVLLLFLVCAWAARSFGQTDSFGTHLKKISLAKMVVGQILRIKTFEDNLIGDTWDSDDKRFMDFTLSVDYGLPPFDRLMRALNVEEDISLHFSFTGRFAQYIDTRESSPVVGKRFNPQLFVQYQPNTGRLRNTLFRLAYGHESNGQSIIDSGSFFTRAFHQDSNINETIDYISRGWDYIGVNTITNFVGHRHFKRIYQAEVNVRYFLDYGLMQGRKEEYMDWESPWYGRNLRRNDVSGLAGAFTIYMPTLFVNKVKVSGETGIASPFRYGSVKFLLGVNVLGLPIAVTYATGYNGDLAQFGKKNTSLSITAVLSSFATPFIREMADR
jgi:hypothetical protein